MAFTIDGTINELIADTTETLNFTALDGSRIEARLTESHGVYFKVTPPKRGASVYVTTLSRVYTNKAGKTLFTGLGYHRYNALKTLEQVRLQINEDTAKELYPLINAPETEEE